MNLPIPHADYSPPLPSRLILWAVDVPQPAPDVVPTLPTPHPTPQPGTPIEIPPLEQPPEIIEPPEPGQHVPVQDPVVPGALGDMTGLLGLRGTSAQRAPQRGWRH